MERVKNRRVRSRILDMNTLKILRGISACALHLMHALKFVTHVEDNIRIRTVLGRPQ